MIREDIYLAIQRAYGDVGEPRYAFVHEAVQIRPYDRVLAELRRWCDIHEKTDLNEDVSFVYSLGADTVIELSMVGPYAVVFRLAGGGAAPDVLSSGRTDLTRLEMEAIRVLAKNGIEVLDRATLEYPVKLRLFYTDPENTRIYQALFSDLDALPWQLIERRADD